MRNSADFGNQNRIILPLNKWILYTGVKIVSQCLAFDISLQFGGLHGNK